MTAPHPAVAAEAREPFRNYIGQFLDLCRRILVAKALADLADEIAASVAR